MEHTQQQHQQSIKSPQTLTYTHGFMNHGLNRWSMKWIYVYDLRGNFTVFIVFILMFHE